MAIINKWPEFYAKDRKTWRRWLEKNSTKQLGIWLIYYKKSSGKPSVNYSEAVEEALCFGWIDSIIKSIDEERYKQTFTPRNPKSEWSALNKKRVEMLRKQDLMKPEGEAMIELSKQNGGWVKIDHVENLEIPPDLKKALQKNKKAAKHFKSLSRSAQKQWLHRLGAAKREETRKKRIAEILALV